MKNLATIALGGGLGALARYGLSALAGSHPLPYAILLINVSGSFLIAVVMVLSVDYGWIPERFRLFSAVGVLGGYTTFSTYMLGIYSLAENRSFVAAFAYTIGTLCFGLAACVVGVAATRRLARRIFWAPARQQEEPDERTEEGTLP
jgi:CrcB protein